MEEVTINDRTWLQDSGVHREVIEKAHGKKIRYYVKVDSYQFQSYATAEVLDDTPKWNPLHRIPGATLCSSDNTSPHSPTAARPAAFEEDLDELRRVVAELLS